MVHLPARMGAMKDHGEIRADLVAPVADPSEREVLEAD